MKLENLTCNNCGSHSLIKISEFEYQCEHCGLTNYLEGASKELIEINSLILHAYEALKREDFTTADEMFSDILSKYPNNYEALWGSIASRYGIVFVNENDKIFPTFHDILDVSFVNETRFQDFIKKVPNNKKNVYLKLANEIESIRNKYFELVKKENPYDIFISFKASDENGNNTKDYFEASNLYSFLTSNGYKVFFSPVSLKGKTGSEYEPYIYHALRTSKIMILYGRKREYIESTWVKNEWGRFLKMIDEKEKLEGSLFVCYENMKAYELPRRFQKLQCIDFSLKTCYTTLLDNIKTIYNKINKKATLEEIDIKKKVSVKKKDSVTTKKVELYEFNDVQNNDELTDYKMEIVDDLINARKYDQAKTNLYNLEKEDLNLGKAQFALLLCDNNLTYNDFYSNINNINKLLPSIKNLIPLCDKNTALTLFINPIANMLLNYKYDAYSKDSAVENIYNFLINYKFDKYNELRDYALEYSIQVESLDIFNSAINLIDGNEVDKHIKYRIRMEDKLLDDKKYDLCNTIIDQVLEIDEGNSHSLYLKLLCKIGNSSIIEVMDDTKWQELDNAISYEKDNNGIIIDFANRVINEGIYDEKFSDAFINIIKRIISNKELRGEYAMKAGNKFLEKAEYNLARNFFEIYISESEKAKEYGYLKLLYCEFNSKDENDLFYQSKKFINSSNYMNALAYSKKNNNTELYETLLKYDQQWSNKQIEKIETEKRMKKIKRKRRINKFIKGLLFLILLVVPAYFIYRYFGVIYSFVDEHLGGVVLYIFLGLLLITNILIIFTYGNKILYAKGRYITLIIFLKTLFYFTIFFGFLLLIHLSYERPYNFLLVIIPTAGFTILAYFIDKKISDELGLLTNGLNIYETCLFFLFSLFSFLLSLSSCEYGGGLFCFIFFIINGGISAFRLAKFSDGDD